MEKTPYLIGRNKNACEDTTTRLHTTHNTVAFTHSGFIFRFHFPRAKAMWSRLSNQRIEIEPSCTHMADGEQWREGDATPCSFVYSKGKHTFLERKALKNTWPFMRLIEVKERARVFEEQPRIQSSESDAREEEVLAWKHDVSFKSKSKCLICKGQYSPSSADMCCARAMCAKKQCSEFVLVI